MQQLAERAEQLAAAVASADPTDLPALAAFHTELQTLRQEAVNHRDRLDPTHLAQVATRAEGLVEQLILREVVNTTATLSAVTSAVTELQFILQCAATDFGIGDEMPPAAANVAKPQAQAAAPAPVPAQPPAPAPTTATAPAEHVPATIDAENLINPDDLPLLAEFITEARGHLESAEAEILKLDDGPENLEAVNAIFRSFHTIKGVAGFLNLKQIGALAHSAENLLDLARHGEFQLSGAVVDVVLDALDLMKLLIESLNEAASNGRAIPQQPRLPSVLRRLDDAAAGRLAADPATPTSAAPTAAPSNVAAPDVASDDVPAAAKNRSGNSNGGAGGEAVVKVATDRLDSLINMVGELVIAQSMVSQDMNRVGAGSQRLARNMAHLGKITRELQDLSMSMRMVPIQGVFQKMARLVRDLGRKFGKEIDLEVIGGDTELDRNVVEAISDPLVHMVRNSVDHGIETADVRAAGGKPRAGRVELKAYHQAGNIVIDITDDGRGLNKAKILKKAKDAGIVREGEELTEQEIFKLIFHAGLSTAEKLTDVSGRGVGMDVVRRNVEALRGRIDIQSTEGKGSTFTIRLPLTLAVIDGMVVRVGNERYILPITAIEQSIQPKPAQVSTVQGRGELCMVRGDLLPLYRLHRLFGVRPKTEDPCEALVVIVQSDDRRACLLVDELLGQQQVVIKSLGERVAARGISGGAILGDGNVSLILDIPGLMELAAGPAAAETPPALAA